jgi:hypothetical protein
VTSRTTSRCRNSHPSKTRLRSYRAPEVKLALFLFGQRCGELFLEPAGQQKDKHDQQYQSQTSAWIVSRYCTATVGSARVSKTITTRSTSALEFMFSPNHGMANLGFYKQEVVVLRGTSCYRFPPFIKDVCTFLGLPFRLRSKLRAGMAYNQR